MDLNDKAMSPTDAVDVDTVEELEELLNEAVENPVNDGVFNKLAFMPQQHIELVVGEDEAEEAEEKSTTATLSTGASALPARPV